MGKPTHPVCLLLQWIPTECCCLSQHQDVCPAPLGKQSFHFSFVNSSSILLWVAFATSQDKYS